MKPVETGHNADGKTDVEFILLHMLRKAVAFLYQLCAVQYYAGIDG
jgi:hypothetical protein